MEKKNEGIPQFRRMNKYKRTGTDSDDSNDSMHHCIICNKFKNKT